MRHRPKQRGFTIIEVLMFLAISGLVFIGGISQYSAQQKSVNFSQGVRDLQAVLSSVINETASSYAPDISSYKCAIASSALTITAAVPPQDNNACIFLGKAFSVGYLDSCTATAIVNCTDSITIPVIGARTDSSGSTTTSYATALPYPLTSGAFASANKLKNNIGVYRMFVRNSDGSSLHPVAGVAFLLDLDSSSHLGNKVDLVALPAGAGSNISKITSTLNKLKNTGSEGTDYYLNPTDGVTFCIKDGNDKLSAISIGAGRSPLDVKVENNSSLDSGC